MQNKLIADCKDYELILSASDITRKDHHNMRISHSYNFSMKTDNMRDTLAGHCGGAAYSIVMGMLRGVLEMHLVTDYYYARDPMNDIYLGRSPALDPEPRICGQKPKEKKPPMPLHEEDCMIRTRIFIPVCSGEKSDDPEELDRISLYSLTNVGNLNTVMSTITGTRLYTTPYAAGWRDGNTVDAYELMRDYSRSKTIRITSADRSIIETYKLDPPYDFSDELKFLPAAVLDILLEERHKDKIFDDYEIKFLNGKENIRQGE